MKWSDLSSEQRNALVAEKVMGWDPARPAMANLNHLTHRLMDCIARNVARRLAGAIPTSTMRPGRGHTARISAWHGRSSRRCFRARRKSITPRGLNGKGRSSSHCFTTWPAKAILSAQPIGMWISASIIVTSPSAQRRRRRQCASPHSKRSALRLNKRRRTRT